MQKTFTKVEYQSKTRYSKEECDILQSLLDFCISVMDDAQIKKSSCSDIPISHEQHVEDFILREALLAEEKRPQLQPCSRTYSFAIGNMEKLYVISALVMRMMHEYSRPVF